MQCIRTSWASFTAFLGYWASNWGKKIRLHRKKIIITLTSLSLLILSAMLILYSYKFVGSLDQSVPINTTSGTLSLPRVTNFGSFLGLADKYVTVPNTNVIIEFNENCRVFEGIVLKVGGWARVRIVGDLLSFVQYYGVDGWRIYIQEKIRNVVIQSVGSFTYFQITNSGLMEAVNVIFSSYSGFAFTVNVISLTITYPQSKDSLGVKLLRQNSQVNQLSSILSVVQKMIGSYGGQMVSLEGSRGAIQGEIQNREWSSRLGRAWEVGVEQFSKSVGGNSSMTNYYLQMYFQNLYNVTYRLQGLQPYQI